VCGPDPAELQAAAEAIARQAGALVLAGFRTARVERTKGADSNLVTDTDLAAERLIVGALAQRFPGHGVLAEEGSQAAGDIVWLVDPLDGTNNFAHGFPMFAVNLAATQGGVVLAGVTYDPLRDELFSARRGGGSTLNGAPLAVSARDRLSVSLVATGFPYDKAENPDNNLAEFNRIVPRVRGIRRGGSAALDLAYVAAGRLDAYWERGIRPWDVGPGLLLVTEAGGCVSDYAGRDFGLDGDRILATNGRLHPELVAALA
jgi:myo-inositol-1(or 4)-monophosphatase